MEQKLWYACLTDTDDNDWGTGSYDLEEAKKWCMERTDIYPDAYIAVISDGDDPVCIDVIHQEDF